MSSQDLWNYCKHLERLAVFLRKKGSNRDIVRHEHIFGQVTLIFIVLLFVGLI